METENARARRARGGYMVKDNVRKSEEAIAPEKFAADLELEVVFAPK